MFWHRSDQVEFVLMHVNGLFVSIYLQVKDLPTFKDNDFTKDNKKLIVGGEAREEFLNRLKRDVDVRIEILFCLAVVLPFFPRFLYPPFSQN